MTYLWMFISIVLFAICLIKQNKYKHLKQDVAYICECVSKFNIAEENRYILVPTDNKNIQNIATDLNRLLDSFYTKKMEYEHSNLATKQIMTNISHDLRTPLTIIRGYSEIIIQQIKKTDTHSDILSMVNNVYDKADELVSVINSYFVMSKLESGDMKINMQTLNVSQIIHDVVLEYYDILDRQQFVVDIQIDSKPVYATADLDSLKRIIRNLIDNAIKYAADGKYIALRVRDDEKMVFIEVEDHGHGISKSEQSKIFSRTFTGGRGSGLGLSIAMNLLEKMQGDIQVIGEEGIGTIFIISLKKVR